MSTSWAGMGSAVPGNTLQVPGAYMLLKPGASETGFNTKVRYIVRRHIATGPGADLEVFAQPITRDHLYSRSENGQLVAGRIRTVQLFIIIAVFILLIACINFMNLSTARSERRAREVGIPQVVGATRTLPHHPVHRRKHPARHHRFYFGAWHRQSQPRRLRSGDRHPPYARSHLARLLAALPSTLCTIHRHPRKRLSPPFSFPPPARSGFSKA